MIPLPSGTNSTPRMRNSFQCLKISVRLEKSPSPAKGSNTQAPITMRQKTMPMGGITPFM